MTTTKYMNAAAISGLMILSGCAQHNWAAGPDAVGKTFGTVSGQCKLVSMGVGGGHVIGAAGNIKFVAVAMAAGVIGNAISTAIQQQTAYNACMEANGFVIADKPAA